MNTSAPFIIKKKKFTPKSFADPVKHIVHYCFFTHFLLLLASLFCSTLFFVHVLLAFTNKQARKLSHKTSTSETDIITKGFDTKNCTIVCALCFLKSPCLYDVGQITAQT